MDFAVHATMGLGSLRRMRSMCSAFVGISSACRPSAGLLEEREESVYKAAAGYSDKATSLFTLDLGSPQDLPDTLRGEAWMFVQAHTCSSPSACTLDQYTPNIIVAMPYTVGLCQRYNASLCEG